MTPHWHPSTTYWPAVGSGLFLCNPPFAMTVPNRDHQHGGMEAVGQLAQNLKGVMRTGDNWRRLTPGEQEALDMVGHKIARILSGADPHDAEHWTDLAGYAHAAMRERS